MPRKTPPGRVNDVARAACEVFTAKGYRRALMTDVADRLELSHALLYRYVESKEALLELAVRYAMDQDSDLTGAAPLSTPPPGHVLKLVKTWFTTHGALPTLRAALKGEPASDVTEELGGIIDELYAVTERNRLLLALVRSLVDDLDELDDASVNRWKLAGNKALADYLARRADSGQLRPLPDPTVGAHLIVESVGWFAWLRKSDPNAAGIDDASARASVRALLLAAFVPDAAATHPAPVRPGRTAR